MKKNPTTNPKIGNGLLQLIRMGKYIRHKWVKCFLTLIMSIILSVICLWHRMGGSSGEERPNPLGRSQVVLVVLRNTSMDPSQRTVHMVLFGIRWWLKKQKINKNRTPMTEFYWSVHFIRCIYQNVPQNTFVMEANTIGPDHNGCHEWSKEFIYTWWQNIFIS